MIGFERDDDEIIRYYQKIKPHDAWGIFGTEFLIRVPLAKAERFMSKDHGWTPETWEAAMHKKDHESVVAEIEDFFQFAWEKAITHRGLSSSKSIHYFLSWAWLLNDMELFAYLMAPQNYANYGCPMLLAVAQKYELMEFLPDNKYDREVFMRMAKGQVCSDICPGGCGLSAPGEFRPMGLILPPGIKVH